MQLIDGIKTRRSVRKFEDKKVPHEVLEQIVEAAAFAPSWKNSQTVRYIAVEDAALKERIATEATMNFTHNKDIISACPVLIVVVTKTGICGYEKDGSYTTSKKDKWEMFDAGMASSVSRWFHSRIFSGVVRQERAMSQSVSPSWTRYPTIPGISWILARSSSFS